MKQRAREVPNHSRTPMHVEVVETLETFRELKRSWDLLIPVCVTRTLFQTYDWHAVWLDSYLKRTDRLQILVVRQGEAVVGIAPLFLRRQTFNGLQENVLGFIGAQNFASDYCDLLVPADRLDLIETLALSLFERLPDWTLLDLLNFPADSPNYVPFIAGLQSYLPRVVTDTVAEAPTLMLEDLNAARALLRKKTVRNKFNYLSKAGKLEFIDLESGEEMNAYLPAFFEQHITRWEAAGTKSIFLTDDNTKFYRELIRRLQPLGWIKFSVLLLDRKPLAFHLGFLHEQRFFYYKTTFDIALSRHSPGLILLKFLLESAIEKQLKEFDFTLGEEEYKYRFANRIRENKRLRLFRRPISFHLMRARMTAGKFKRKLFPT